MSSPKPKPEIRRATVLDMPKVLDFVDQTYGAGAAYKNEARHHWQFEANPFRPAHETQPTIWLALDGARVVGTIAVQDGVIWLGEEPVPACWIVDVMVHPGARGQGLSHQIHAAIMAERAVLVTLTMAPATRRVAERAGAITLGPTRLFILPLRVSARLVARFLDHKAHTSSRARARILRVFNASAIGPMIAAATGRFLGFAARMRASSQMPTGFHHEEVDRFPDEIDDLWDRVRPRSGHIFERSARFLNWRFLDCPGLSYRRFLLYKNGALAGYLVTRLGDPAELPLGVVADAFADPSDGAALDALLILARNVLSSGSEYLEAAASAPAWQDALRRAGFIATKTMRPTIVCTDPNLRARLASTGNDWHFTKADHDWDQIHPI
ncbi:MAG: GNAT family N-acetyltransferase [Pseudomonadota bacterium]